ncbi:MAG TPA: VC0807 family protein [Streptosporangiaceae bacterium]
MTAGPEGPSARPGNPGGTLVTLGVDVVLPIVLYYSLHAAGFSSIVALAAGAAVPALGAAVKLIKNRHLDMLAVLVVASAALSIALSFVSGSPRFLLAKDGWITGAWGVWMLMGARAARPPTYVIARPLMEGRRIFGTASWEKLWEQSPDFRRMWRVTAVMWGLALLADAGIRILMAYALPVSVVPALAGALYPVTVLVLQVVTNVYFHRAGLYRMLGARWASRTGPGR